MAASIKPIDGKSVHRIQSGQVIVDLCSVVKELVENSIDAGATNIDVRFKNQGLDLIEVQDNGSGISPANYPSVALKHHTSKLSTFNDIASLQTFGFRGEALSSLCALSNLAVTTCIQADVPKGSRLSFEPSGQLGDTVIVAAQRGTIVSVEGLFHNLPVRRRELERNIKREWQKVVALLSQYACIQTNIKLSVSQQPNKGKRVALFSTRGNSTTRENIINIFGAKTMSALVSMELDLEIQPTMTPINPEPTAGARIVANRVCVVGHISRPSPGDGRLTPDRQMFFVNGRPCGLPQFAKTFNEVYRSFNHSQSPFIFADVRLDTQMYDVNVSPDKRSILLHDQGRLLDTLRTSLTTLFESHDCAVPVSQLGASKRGLRSHHGLAWPTTESLANFKPGFGKTMVDKSRPSDDAAAGSSDDSDTDSDAELSRHDANSDADVNRPQHRPKKDQNLMSQWLKKDPRPAASSTASISVRNESRPTSRRGSDANTLAEPTPDATGTCLSVQVFTASQGNLLMSSRPVRGSNPRLADKTVTAALATIEQKMDDNASSVHSLTDGDDELSGETDIRAVQPMRLGNRRSTHPRLSKSPPTRSALDTADNVSATGDGKLAEGSRTSNERCEPGSREPSQNIANAAKRSDEDAPMSADPGGMSMLGKSSARLHKDARPGDDDDVRPSGDGSSLLNELDAVAAQPTSPNPRLEACLEPISDASSKAQPRETGLRRSNLLWQAVQRLLVDEEDIRSRMNYLESHRWTWGGSAAPTADQVEEDIGASDAESKLSLIISRSDFSAMRVVGQFNMGFIIAVRPATSEAASSSTARHDELFIIDQHASDEKYNFERLQGTTIVQSQRLVHARKLQLTALEEEIVMGNLAAIEANGFHVAVDASGDSPVGSRCEVLALPLSRETTFSLDDLEELIALLGDEPTESEHIPRPSKVRNMFAMRACRSSVMIGKALTRNQMHALVRQMGELDKPWNCPHGRPTMRHLCRLEGWDEKRWQGDAAACPAAAWRSYGGGD